MYASFGVTAVFPTHLLVVPPAGATTHARGREAWLQKACIALQQVAREVSTRALPFTAAAFQGVIIQDGQQ